MQYSLNEEQQLLQDSARKLLDLRSPVSAARALRDNADESGFSRELWSEVAELGWSGILVPEALGGVDLGYVAAGIIAEQCGRTLAALPFLSTAVTAVSALLQGGTAQQQQSLLPRIAAGECLVALAIDERSRHAPQSISSAVVAQSDGYRLSGRKIFVLDGHVADYLIVSARLTGTASGTGGPTALFLVESGSPGVEIERTCTIDGRNAADVRLSDVRLTDEHRLSRDRTGQQLLDSVLDAARALLAAELVGIARECLHRTSQYLCQRKQFGKKLAEFQALQHRLAHLFCEVELAVSIAHAACGAIQENHEDSSTLVSAAKAKCGEVATLAASEALQMHGGIGMTDELDIGLFVKRARSAGETYGDVAFHRDRVARSYGF